jgi:hypothetical protein
VHGGDHQRSLEIRLEDDGPFKKGYGFCHNCKATVFVIEMDPRRAAYIERDQQGDGRSSLSKIDLLKPRSRGVSTPDQWQQKERSVLTDLYTRMRTALVQSERVQAYLRERAIPLEIAQAAGVVYLPPSALKSPDLEAQRTLVEKWADRLIFPLWAADGRRGYAGRTLCLWKPGIDENEHKCLVEEFDKQAGKDERRKIRRWRKTNPVGYFGVGFKSLASCIVVVEGAFDRLALLAGGLESPDVIALVGTALQAEILPLQVQSVVLALDGELLLMARVSTRCLRRGWTRWEMWRRQERGMGACSCSGRAAGFLENTPGKFAILCTCFITYPTRLRLLLCQVSLRHPTFW